MGIILDGILGGGIILSLASILIAIYVTTEYNKSLGLVLYGFTVTFVYFSKALRHKAYLSRALLCSVSMVAVSSLLSMLNLNTSYSFIELGVNGVSYLLLVLTVLFLGLSMKIMLDIEKSDNNFTAADYFIYCFFSNYNRDFEKWLLYKKDEKN